MSGRILFGLVGFSVLIAFTSCQKDEPTDHESIIRRSVYSNPISLGKLNEIPCASVPDYFHPPYSFSYRDSHWISQVIVHPSNDQLIAYSIQTQPTERSLLSTNYIRVHNLSTREDIFIDSTEDVPELKWGGNYLIKRGRKAILFDVSNHRKTELNGSVSDISPNGKWATLVSYDTRREEVLLNLESYKVHYRWTEKERFHNSILGDSKIYHEHHTEDRVRQVRVFDLFSHEDEILIDNINFWHELVCFVDTNRILTKHGVLINLKTKTTETIHPINIVVDTNHMCESKWLEPISYLPLEEKILCKKWYYDFNPNNNVVTHYVRYHILNLDGSNEERVQLNF